MRENMQAASGGGLGLSTILGTVFVTLKLTEQVDWSWWWVLAPWWVPFGFIFIVTFFAFLFTRS